MPPKGPPKRQPAPRDFDNVGLKDALLGYFATAASVDLGAYRNVGRARAVLGAALLALHPLLSLILKFCPGCELIMSFLVPIFAKVVADHPELNGEGMADKQWATFMAERIITVLAHLRRVAQNEQKFKEATKGMSSLNLGKFSALVAMVRRPRLFDGPTPAGPAERSLERHASNVTEDSDGFPAMLQSPKKAKKDADHLSSSPSKSRRVEPAAMDAAFLQRTLQELQAASPPQFRSWRCRTWKAL